MSEANKLCIQRVFQMTFILVDITAQPQPLKFSKNRGLSPPKRYAMLFLSAVDLNILL